MTPRVGTFRKPVEQHDGRAGSGFRYPLAKASGLHSAVGECGHPVSSIDVDRRVRSRGCHRWFRPRAFFSSYSFKHVRSETRLAVTRFGIRVHRENCSWLACVHPKANKLTYATCCPTRTHQAYSELPARKILFPRESP